MEAHMQGREIVVVFNEDLGAALGKACENDSDSDAVHLAKAAIIVRRDMFAMKRKFNGSFDTQGQEESVPISLKVLVNMVLNGPNIKSQSGSSSISQPALTITQPLFYNSSKRYKEDTDIVRHIQKQKTLLPIYLGVMIHTNTRKRKLLTLCLTWDCAYCMTGY